MCRPVGLVHKIVLNLFIPSYIKSLSEFEFLPVGNEYNIISELFPMSC